MPSTSTAAVTALAAQSGTRAARSGGSAVQAACTASAAAIACTEYQRSAPVAPSTIRIPASLGYRSSIFTSASSARCSRR